MTEENEKRMYKRKFTPAKWVPYTAACNALEVYEKLYKKITKAERERCDTKAMYIQYKAIEALCTDKKIKDFWQVTTKDGCYDVHPMMMGSFFGIFISYRRGPRITEKERDKKLKKIDDLLKEICELIVSDSSIHDRVYIGFLNTINNVCDALADSNPEYIKKGSPRCFPPLAGEPTIFIQKLRENIESCSIKTHSDWPLHIRNEKKAERVYFMHQISELVQYAYSYRRQNHAMTARILNVIRPDLGKFTEDNVRLTVGKLWEPKPLHEK